MLDSFTISMDGWYISYLFARSIFTVTEKKKLDKTEICNCGIAGVRQQVREFFLWGAGPGPSKSLG